MRRAELDRWVGPARRKRRPYGAELDRWVEPARRKRRPDRAGLSRWVKSRRKNVLSMMIKRRWFRCARARLLVAIGLFLAGWVGPLYARPVRVATWNVEFGIGSPGGAKYGAQKAILRRIDADIVAFQELGASTSNEWVRLAGELGYPYRAWGEIGPFSGDMVVGFYSRFPVVETRSVGSPPGAVEMSRLPLGVTVEVPGAARPLALWTMHHKAEFRHRDCFRRAVEARRVMEDVARYRAAHADRTELIILGDMNDDAVRAGQPVLFKAPHPEVPGRYRLGRDVAFPLRYQPFPESAYGAGFHLAPAHQPGTTNAVTHRYTNLRLDYLFVSPALWTGPHGPVRGVVYRSERDPGGVPRGATEAASDHYPVVVEVHLPDAPPIRFPREK